MTLHSAKNIAIVQWMNSFCFHGIESIQQLHDGKILCDVIKSVFNVPFEGNCVVESSVEVLVKEENSTEPGESSVQTLEETYECDIFKKRFKFLQDFINDTYHIESQNFISYEDCAKSGELELAKVAVFVLTAIVQTFLKLNNTQVMTLTLLESKVQEDIQECLTLLLQNADKLSKEELEKVLGKAAKYKASTPKRQSLSTPRSCSSKYRTPEEETYSNSPLKSFLESPQVFNQASRTKEELLKTKKILRAEEMKIDELEDEVGDLRRKLKAKDLEIQNLKKEAKRKKSREHAEEYKECKNCKGFESELEHCKRINKELQEDIQILRKQQEAYETRILHADSLLEARRKMNDNINEEYSQIKILVPRQEKVIEQQKEEIKKLTEEIEEMKRNHRKDISILEERLTETRLVFKQEEGEVGETLDVIMEENEQGCVPETQTVQMPQPDLDAKERLPNHVIKKEYSPAKDISDVPGNDLMNKTDISESNQTIKCDTIETHGSSVQTGSILSDSSNLDCVVEQNSTKQDVPATSFTTSNGLGSLWAKYTDSDGENHDGSSSLNNKHDLGKSRDLLKQLGFSVSDYTSRMNAVRKLCAALKDVFAPSGSNGYVSHQTLGDWEQSIQSDEDQLLCLLYIRESLLKFQNNNSVSRDCIFTDKLCGCYSAYNETLNKLKKEKEDLTVEFSKLKKDFASQIRHKRQELKAAVDKNTELQAALSSLREKQEENVSKTMAENQELKRQLKGLNIVYESKISTLEKRDVQLEQMTKDIERLNELVTCLSERAETTQENYVQVQKEKKELTEKYNNRIRHLREKTMEFDKVRRDLEHLIGYEKEKRRKVQIEKAGLEIRLRQLINENKNLESSYKEASSENARLLSIIGELRLAGNTTEAIPETNTTEAIPETNTTEAVPETERESSNRETVQVSRIETTDSAASQLCDISIERHDISTHSGALFGRHSFVLDDEESYLNHSSIVDTRSEKRRRLLELQRRNSIVPPHMRSAYAPEIQWYSPYHRKIYDFIRNPFENNSIRRNLFSAKKVSKESIKKKRKASELESDNEVTFRKGRIIPDSLRRKMRPEKGFKIKYRNSNEDYKPNQP